MYMYRHFTIRLHLLLVNLNVLDKKNIVILTTLRLALSLFIKLIPQLFDKEVVVG